MNPDLGFTMYFQVIGMLLIVLGLMIGILYLMKRLSNKFGTQASGTIKTLATHHISPKEKIILIEVMGERLLVGSTPQSINQIATLKDSSEFQFPEEKKPEFFKNILKKALNKEAEKETEDN
ncbi:MAG: flagellar biosynthetic protein FliO [Desulfobacterales bacterium]|nr:flagellar biosynthetic protein FliO [Desulfobacterales bacterium]MCP4161722.1 flagellar biosynthetic protein FliO [Deltaproteobacteria bacterium]